MSEVAAWTPAYGEVDLTNCDREPIHIPGAVQPHGFLLALEQGSLTVAMASRSTAEHLGIEAEDLLGQPLADVLGAELSEEIQLATAAEEFSEPLRGMLRAGGSTTPVECDVVLHLSQDRLVVEVEPVGSSTGVSAVSYRSARAAVARLSETRTVTELSARLAREIRALTGFDRVMVYRFDAQWNGEVIAEDRREDLNPFLGLHYPATDIPAQARRLYTVNWTRLIADIGYRPSPLHPVLDPLTDAPLDLSHSVLRSVSPIHVEYLANMGVTASMSVSLVLDGKLWGLIACHHYSGPHRPSYDARSAAEFLGQTASQLVAARERSDERDDALRAAELLTALASDVASRGRDPLSSLITDTRLLELVGAGGAALKTRGQVFTQGKVPHRAALEHISAMLSRSDGAPTFTDHLASLDPRLGGVQREAAGALRVGLGPGEWLLWLRPEQEEVVDWGGDPRNKEIAETEEFGVRLSPRRSFEKWREVVRGRSMPWSRWHAEMAERTRTQITSVVLGRSRDQIAIAESLQRAVVLDEAPEFPGITVLARYAPASGSQLGGDWWDALELDDGRIAFVVGDVSGHGVRAAAAMAQLRTALRAYLLEGHGPGGVLDRLDRLVDSLITEHMATAVVAVLDADRRAFSVAAAGHPPPLLITTERAEQLEVPNRPLLGVGGGTAETMRLQVRRGTVLALYSDGLVERRTEPLDVSIRSLTTAAGDGTDAVVLDLPSLAHRMLEAVPGGADDDTTLLLVRIDDFLD